ncbi:MULTISPECIES: thioredoxin,-like protein [unclassified Sphingobacterium]|uniref:thioredoxin,-like protein n=1 Tax=unclassified Sphingobacterium TaxID=2609468 RepID=UPI0025D76F37|nr:MULTISPECIES: thioredoxin,-like protein [unclassified Sphingobacterium]
MNKAFLTIIFSISILSCSFAQVKDDGFRFEHTEVLQAIKNIHMAIHAKDRNTLKKLSTATLTCESCTVGKRNIYDPARVKRKIFFTNLMQYDIIPWNQTEENRISIKKDRNYEADLYITFYTKSSLNQNSVPLYQLLLKREHNKFKLSGIKSLQTN